jgi:isoleucyl-tRNA synthetase
MLALLAGLDAIVRESYAAYDFKRAYQAVSNFCINDLSAFYFDIRKDALYCEPIDSLKRLACLSVLDEIFSCLTAWLAPMLCFTMEEAWLARFPSDEGSVHLRLFPTIPKGWNNAKLAEKWETVREVRRVVTGALELERAAKRIGASLEAAPIIHVDSEELAKLLKGIDLAELCITSAASLSREPAPADAFRLPDVRHVAVVPARAVGRRCARSWRILETVGSDPDYPTLSPRDAEAVRQWEAAKGL